MPSHTHLFDLQSRELQGAKETTLNWPSRPISRHIATPNDSSERENDAFKPDGSRETLVDIRFAYKNVSYKILLLRVSEHKSEYHLEQTDIEQTDLNKIIKQVISYVSCNLH